MYFSINNYFSGEEIITEFQMLKSQFLFLYELFSHSTLLIKIESLSFIDRNQKNQRGNHSYFKISKKRWQYLIWNQKLVNQIMKIFYQVVVSHLMKVCAVYKTKWEKIRINQSSWYSFKLLFLVCFVFNHVGCIPWSWMSTILFIILLFEEEIPLSFKEFFVLKNVSTLRYFSLNMHHAFLMPSLPPVSLGLPCQNFVSFHFFLLTCCYIQSGTEALLIFLWNVSWIHFFPLHFHYWYSGWGSHHLWSKLFQSKGDSYVRKTDTDGINSWNLIQGMVTWVLKELQSLKGWNNMEITNCRKLLPITPLARRTMRKAAVARAWKLEVEPRRGLPGRSWSHH